MGIADHQVERASNRSIKSLLLLVYRTGLLLWWGLLSLPGVILHAPVFVLAKIISRQKAKGEFKDLDLAGQLFLSMTMTQAKSSLS